MQLLDPIPVRLTLVSASPRRRDLLLALNIPFDIAPGSAEELLAAPDPAKLAIENAGRKVRLSAHFGTTDRLLIGADTVVVVEGRCLGKPADPEEAELMLQVLSGRHHEVITGVCLSGPARDRTSIHTVEGYSQSVVEIRELTEEELKQYLISGEWQDKAGAYGIQGLAGEFSTVVSGEFENVVGLPVRLVNELIRNEFGHCVLL